MSASFMLRSGADGLAKTVHSVSASVTTVFLFTRIWARATYYKGLWWDDYISVSFIYFAMALSKTAFATTMIRLSEGRTRTLLWVIIAIVCTVNTASAIVAWVEVCEAGVEMASLSKSCVHITTTRWIHVGSAICTIFADIVLAYIPWRITAKVFIPTQEKLGVSISLSLVGLAVPVCITKAVLGALAPDGSGEHGMPDWTYGLIVITCLAQAEVAIYIIAQTLPILRVVIQGDVGRTRSVTGSGLNKDATSFRKAHKATARTALDTIEEVRQSIEVVQLPSGLIVPADSEEGRAFKSTHTTTDVEQITPPSDRGPTGATAPSHPGQDESGITVDDEVHKLWSDMGLSRRAWSKSASPSPEGESSGVQQRLD
ncbi:hypothetical protein SLS53_004844 [Cytospora paraplurivora]|uniref:Rhodopsin domain-containing protein n=1 Tax=Cytospora paraplurivora TaxID=2898453 RepID=A0AAN9U705_9PEZI